MPEVVSPVKTEEVKQIKYSGIYTGGKSQFGIPQALDERFMVQLKVKIDKETLSTVPDESDKLDLVALIQTYRDQCGMEYVIKLLKTGQAQPGDFRDDGKHSGTIPEELDTAQGRANAAVAARFQAEQMARALGLPDKYLELNDEQLSALVSKTIAEKYPTWIKNQETKNDAE